MKKIFILSLLLFIIISSLFSGTFNKKIFEQYIGKRVFIFLKNYRNNQEDTNGSFNTGMVIKEVYDDYIVCSDFKDGVNYYYILIDEIASIFIFKAVEESHK